MIYIYHLFCRKKYLSTVKTAPVSPSKIIRDGECLDHNNILISVIIPFYKGEKYICQCIDSVLNQPYRNIEVILINDGSPSGEDVCLELVKKDNRITYYSKTNEGIGATRNYGIERAHGDYLAFLDQDDVWTASFLTSEIVDLLKNNYDLYSFQCLRCDEYLTRYCNIGEDSPKLFKGGYEAAISSGIHHSAHFFKNEFLKENDLKYILTRHEDVIFMYKCYLTASSIYHFNKPMFLYRNNPSSETHRNKAVEKVYIPIVESWMDFEKWALLHFPDNDQLFSWIRHMTCVYALEGIVMMYRNGYNDETVDSILTSYTCRDYLENYQSVMLSGKWKNVAQEFYNNRSKLKNREKTNGTKDFYTSILKKSILIRRFYYYKHYPVLLPKNYTSTSFNKK